MAQVPSKWYIFVKSLLGDFACQYTKEHPDISAHRTTEFEATYILSQHISFSANTARCVDLLLVNLSISRCIRCDACFCRTIYPYHIDVAYVFVLDISLLHRHHIDVKLAECFHTPYTQLHYRRATWLCNHNHIESISFIALKLSGGFFFVRWYNINCAGFDLI